MKFIRNDGWCLQSQHLGTEEGNSESSVDLDHTVGKFQKKKGLNIKK